MQLKTPTPNSLTRTLWSGNLHVLHSSCCPGWHKDFQSHWPHQVLQPFHYNSLRSWSVAAASLSLSLGSLLWGRPFFSQLQSDQTPLQFPWILSQWCLEYIGEQSLIPAPTRLTTGKVVPTFQLLFPTFPTTSPHCRLGAVVQPIALLFFIFTGFL